MGQSILGISILSAGRPFVRDQKQAEVINKYQDFEAFILKWLSHDASFSLIHFTPMHKFIESTYGEISLDFIGRYENLQQDYNYVRNQLNVGQALPKKNISHKQDYRSMYTNKMIDRVASVYERDIKEFGYDF